MRKIACLAALVMLLPACGGGEKKAAFERYEEAVEPVLAEEAELRARYAEELRNVTAYRDQSGFDTLVRNLVPFYERMEKTVGSVAPEGSDLERIHGILVSYVQARREIFRLDEKARATSEREKPALEKLDAASESWQEKVKELQKAIEGDPGSMEAIAMIFGQEQQAVSALFHNLDAMRQNLVEAEEFLKHLDEQIVPFYDDLEDRLGKLDSGKVGKGVLEGAKAYFTSIDELIAATREVARIRPELKKELIPLQQRYGELQDEADRLIESYKEEAKRYRDSLR